MKEIEFPCSLEAFLAPSSHKQTTPIWNERGLVSNSEAKHLLRIQQNDGDNVQSTYRIWGLTSQIAVVFIRKSDLVSLLKLLGVLLHHRLIDCNLRRCQSWRLNKEKIRVAHELLCKPLFCQKFIKNLNKNNQQR